MNEQQIEEIKNSLRQIMQIISARGQPLSEEIKAFLARVLDHAANSIEELRQQIQAPTEAPIEAPGVPNLQPGPFPSSNVNSFKYDPQKQQLFVKFHGKDTADSGPTYSYVGIPEYIFDIFRRGAIAPKTSGGNKYHSWYRGVTPSLGASMSALIKKGNFPYQRVA
jgi:hypothetical protein